MLIVSSHTFFPISNFILVSNFSNLVKITSYSFIQKTGFDYITISGGHYDLIKDLKRNDNPEKCEYFYQNLIITVCCFFFYLIDDFFSRDNVLH